MLQACPAPGARVRCPGDSNVLWTLDAQAALFVKASGRCMDVNGAVGPLDIWDCDREVPVGVCAHGQAEFKNTSWQYNATDSSIRSLDTDTMFHEGFCLTVMRSRPAHWARKQAPAQSGQ